MEQTQAMLFEHYTSLDEFYKFVGLLPSYRLHLYCLEGMSTGGVGASVAPVIAGLFHLADCFIIHGLLGFNNL